MIAALARIGRDGGASTAADALLGALPGIRVVAAPAAGPALLPRMDLACFAGFASSGPVDCPLSIDSVAAFEAVFGADPPLAWDTARGATLRGLLGPAVRAFFENGGRRAVVIRVAHTPPRLALLPSGMRAEEVGSGNRFALPGLMAFSDAGLSAASAAARSLGSWSDGLLVRTRALREGFRPGEVDAAGTGGLIGLAGAGAARLAAGHLVELADSADARRAYLRVERVSAGLLEARLLARFTRLAAGPARLGEAHVPGLDATPRPARLVPGEFTRLLWLDGAPEGLSSGHVLRFEGGGETVLVDSGAAAGAALDAGGAARGPAFALGDTGPLPTARAARVTLELMVEGGGGTASLETGYGLTPTAPSSWWGTLNDDRFYRPGDAAVARAPLASESVTEGAPLAFLPLFLEAGFGAGLPPLPQPRDRLTRDGLARFDAGLFLDLRLARLGLATMAAEAERILAEPGGRLHGIHGVLALPFGPEGDLPSILAVPDAVHAGWAMWQDEAAPLPAADAVEAPGHWVGHRGPCPADEAELVAPAFERFLDCGTRMLPTPELLLPEEPVPPGPLVLRWTEAESGASYMLELSGSPDMAGAAVIARVEGTEHPILLEREGAYYFRLTAELGGEVSRPALGLVQVRASSWRAAEAADAAVLGTVHRALLRLAAAEGSMFALLSLPRGWSGEEAVAAADRLRAPRGLANPDSFVAGERRALSHGMLLDGWLLAAGRPARPGDPVPLAASPPCGAVAGIFARRTIAGGAWLSLANQPLSGAVALARPLAMDTAQALVEGHVMPVAETPIGYALADARTLADEDEWRPVGTRRLFGLLRRLIAARASAYVFEPNAPLLHRSIERGLSEALLTLFRAGAFAGFKPNEAFRVTVRATAQDRDNGRLVTDIAVAPARPLAFLTLVLRQLGERLTFEEAR